MLQWGKYAGKPASTVYFPTAFDTFYSIGVGEGDNKNASGYVSKQPWSITNTSFRHASTDIPYITWIAIGSI